MSIFSLIKIKRVFSATVEMVLTKSQHDFHAYLIQGSIIIIIKIKNQIRDDCVLFILAYIILNHYIVIEV